MEDVNENAVKVVRAVMKLSSALNNSDVLLQEKTYVKFKLKKHVILWAEKFPKITAPLMSALYEESSVLLDEIYAAVDGLDLSVSSNDRHKNSLLLLYAKIKSAMADIESIDSFRLNIYFLAIHHYSKNVVDEIDKMYPFVRNMKDKDGTSMDELISFYNEMGEKIMYSKKQENELGRMDDNTQSESGQE